ncbi:MAG: SDR family oxidoreductase [Planctomycetales bacterium]|nr:SDR family oxidoreductase [Planctomycetales bacterium]
MSKRIVLTGATRGLGLAMVEEFVSRGHVVCGCGRSEKLIGTLHQRFGPPHQFAAVDVADEPAVAAWASQVLHDGPPDLLLNNAAVINRNAPLWEIGPDEFSRLVDVNVKGVFHVLRHFLPAMVAREHGVIVNFSSGWGRSTSPDVAPYCASKWAIEGLTRALAQELPPGMAAIPLNPGVINTEMLQSCFGEAAAAYPSSKQWAHRAVPFLLDLSYADNGDPLTAPS